MIEGQLIGMTRCHATVMQAAEHWRMSALQKGFAALQHAAHLKRTGQQILANFLSRRVRAAWNAWTDMVQVRALQTHHYAISRS